MINTQNFEFDNTPVSKERPNFNYIPIDRNSVPCVSIITPFYNANHLFHDTAKSVFGQSFQQWEWVIVNDGSTNSDSLTILDKYRDLDNRIRVVDHEINKGLSAARNTAYQEAKTDFILQLDTDDLLEPTKIEKCFWFLNSYTEYSFVKGYSVGFGFEEYLWQKGFHLKNEFLEKNLVTPTVMVRKQAFIDACGFDETNRRGLEDWDFWLRCASNGDWGTTIPEYLDWYRRRDNHNDRWSNWDDGKNERKFQKNLKNKYKNLWKDGIPDISVNIELSEQKVFEEIEQVNLLTKKKKRILLVIPWMTMGGADKFNLDLVRQFIEKDYEVSIITTLAGDNIWHYHFAQFTPDLFILSNFLKFHDYPKFIKNFIASRDIDVLFITHSEFGYFILPFIRYFFPDLTIADYCHIEEEDWHAGGYPKLSVEYQKYIDLNIVSSNHLKNWMVNKGADKNKIQVCYTNINEKYWQKDSDTRRSIRDELKIDDNTTVILFSGRICEQKQPGVLVDTVSKLKSREDINYLVLIAGDGEDMEQLRSEVNKRGLDGNVMLLGQTSNERVRELMSASDVYFLPSRWEGISLSIYEAMSCGLPVVGSDVGGQKELVTPDCGYLIDASNQNEQVQQYSKILTQLIRDKSKRTELGNNARKRICESFTMNMMGETILECMRIAATKNDSNSNFGISYDDAKTKLLKGMNFLRITRGLHDINSNFTDIKTVNPQFINLRYTLYRSINYFYEPLYMYAKKRGWNWLFTVADKIKRLVLGT